jgi:hypothetical protein
LYLDNPVNARNASPIVARALAESEMDATTPDEVVFQVSEQVMTIRAVAHGVGQGRFARSAIVRLPPRGGQGPPVAQILTWTGG